MVHDTQRVESIRQRTAAQVHLLSTLKARIAKGNLPQLQIVRNRLRDIEEFFLRHLEIENLMPEEEKAWLTYAESMLNIWAAELAKVETARQL